METAAIRPAQGGDLPAVAAIYAHEAATSHSTFDHHPRPLSEWEHRLSSTYPFLVGEVDGVVMGYAYASAFRDRPAYHRTVETSVYVSEEARGQRLAARLYDELIGRLRSAGFHTALGVVALPNEASVRLHERAGFAHAGTLREVGDKFGRMIDVGLYQLML